MGIDDLLGLAFLIFFVILPAIQGLLRRERPPIDPDFDPDILEPEPKPKPAPARPSPQANPSPAKPPAPRPQAAPAPTPPPPAPRPMVSDPPKPQPKPQAAPKSGRSLEQIERERLARSGSKPASSPPKKAPVSKEQISTPAQEFQVTPRAILNGVVWHQILAEPRRQYWRRQRKPKR